MSFRALWQTLHDPTRLRILALLEEVELSVAELQEILHLGQLRISTHLANLRRVMANRGFPPYFEVTAQRGHFDKMGGYERHIKINRLPAWMFIVVDGQYHASPLSHPFPL